MPSWIVWVQRPSGLIKSAGSERAFKSGYFDWGRECEYGYQ